MTHTTHNHWIPGTPHQPLDPGTRREQCGGIGVCTQCSHEFGAAPKSTSCLDHEPKEHRDMRPAWCKNCGLTGGMGIPFTNFELRKKDYLLGLQEKYLDPNITAPRKEGEAPTDKARRLVVDHFNTGVHRSDDFKLTFEQTYVVSFTYVLGSWKAMVSTDIPDSMYYEVTYDKAKNQAYVDKYLKVGNSVHQDIPAFIPAGVGG